MRLSSNEALRFTSNAALMKSYILNITPRMMLLAQLGTCHLWNEAKSRTVRIELNEIKFKFEINEVKLS